VTERPWALVEQVAQLFAAGGIEDSMRPMLGRRRTSVKGGESELIEGPDRVADGLVVAGELIGNLLGVQAPLRGKENLAAAQREARWRAELGGQRLLFLGRHIPDIHGSSHAT
jgi:hypothetical protein